ncbi:hypothetical protein BJ878DRAFT_521988 [Calycina marina]|uniref:Uncharacterized protein n=1 Tax=Calycina marina TaxID=1763456 RepID=A0A9P7YXS2_9HELO|nr:hypothetical protein BJ878DRAFT_521988 [Calycina marina]
MLRSGHQLQWRNIAAELVAQDLNLSHEETYLLALQTALQAGPWTTVSRVTCRSGGAGLWLIVIGCTRAHGRIPQSTQ